MRGLLNIRFGYKTWNLDGRYKVELVNCTLAGRMPPHEFLSAMGEIKNLSDLKVPIVRLKSSVTIRGVMPDGKPYSKTFAGNEIILKDVAAAETMNFRIDTISALIGVGYPLWPEAES